VEPIEIRRGRVATALDGLRYPLGTDVLDEGLAALDHRHFLGVDVESGDGEACFLEDECERQSYVALPDDSDAGSPIRDALK